MYIEDDAVRTIGERIKQARKAKGHTQETLAGQVEVDSTTVASWENGPNTPRIRTLLKLCNLFECDLGHLVGEYPEYTRQAADVHAEIGLSTEAVEQLRQWEQNAVHEPLQGVTSDYYDAQDAKEFLLYRAAACFLESRSRVDEISG